MNVYIMKQRCFIYCFYSSTLSLRYAVQNSVSKSFPVLLKILPLSCAVFFFFALGVDGQELIFVNVCIRSLLKNSVYTIKCLLYISLGDKKK